MSAMSTVTIRINEGQRDALPMVAPCGAESTPQ